MVLGLALPDNKDFPASGSQSLYIERISLFVAFKFRRPVRKIGLRKVSKLAVVRMPEAPMHKDNLLMRWENKIGFPWEIGAVQAVAVTHSMNELSNRKLRLHSGATDSAHICATVHAHGETYATLTALFPCFKASMICAATARATGGGKALPI